MRLSILPILLAGASVVSLVAAEPIRTIEDTNDNIRLGHELANANVNGNDDNVAHIVHPANPILPPPHAKGKGHHFCGASLREKAIRLSNAFRHALGLPLIGADTELPRPGPIHIISVGYPGVMLHGPGELDEEGKPRRHPDGGEDPEDHHDHHHKHHKHHHKHHHKNHHKSFLRRIHSAIKALGPWEGRAVAFVLGCGIGVLLRMFWVLSVLAYRTVRGERLEETLDREYIVYEHAPEALFVAPPRYIDEKVSEEIEERK